MAAEDAGLSVSRMSEATGVAAHPMRHHERAGLIGPVARDSSDQRGYSATDVRSVMLSPRLRETGMPIVRMREHARLRASGPITVEARSRLLEAHQASLRAQRARMRADEEALAAKTATYRGALELPRPRRTDGEGDE